MIVNFCEISGGKRDDLQKADESVAVKATNGDSTKEHVWNVKLKNIHIKFN